MDLVNREEERAAVGGVLTQCCRHVAALPEVEAIERFVDEQDALRSEEPDGQQNALPLSLRECADARVEHCGEVEPGDDVLDSRPAGAKEVTREIECPANRLSRPWRDSIWQIEEVVVPLAGSHHRVVDTDGPGIRGQQPRETLEERRLAGTIRADQAEDLAVPQRERHAVECRHAAVALG